jgi:hypothetical protein
MLITQSSGQVGLRVEPDQVLRLKADLESIYHEVDDFLKTKGATMVMLPLGADPVSADSADAFNENSQAAMDATNGFLKELEGVLHALDQTAKTYDLVDETHAQAWRQGRSAI